MATRGRTAFTKEQDAKDTRIEKWRKYQRFLLVVCEDQHTEPEYIKTFKQHFPKHSLYLEIAGAGKDPLGIVHTTIEKRLSLAGVTKREIDEIWIVFDKDDADLNQARIDRFNEAFDVANENNFNIAWSNEVFELWFLLHFMEVNPAAPIARTTIYNDLKNVINKLAGKEVIEEGHSNSKIIPFLTSHGNENKAISRAQALLLHHSETPPISANPATKMHLLVKSLRDWIAYYNYQA